MAGLNYSTVFFSLFSINIDELKSYYEVMEEFLDREKNNISSKIESINLSQEPDESELEYNEMLIDRLSEDYTNISKKFSHNLRVSLVVQIMSLFEINLKKVCDFHHSFYKTSFGVEDLSGDDLEKCKKYLVKCCNVNFGKLNTEWSYLNTLRKIRNVFIHHNGIVTEQRLKSWNLDTKFFIENGIEMKQLRENREYALEFEMFILDKNLINQSLKYKKRFFEKLLIDNLSIKFKEGKDAK